MVTAVCKVGSSIKGLKIKPTKMVGIESCGMCCSEAELGVGSDDEGLIDIKEPTESYSVKDFQDTVRMKIKEISERGKTPIIVGGTGLYIKAALYDYEFKETQDDHSLIQEKYKDYDNVALYNHLCTIDEASAKELHPNNRRRVLRAIEIFEQTGEKKSSILEKQEHVCLYDAYFVGLTLDRDVLYERINHRVDVMVDHGLEQEIETLLR